jgi:hypothetical protein
VCCSNGGVAAIGEHRDETLLAVVAAGASSHTIEHSQTRPREAEGGGTYANRSSVIHSDWPMLDQCWMGLDRIVNIHQQTSQLQDKEHLNHPSTEGPASELLR